MHKWIKLFLLICILCTINFSCQMNNPTKEAEVVINNNNDIPNQDSFVNVVIDDTLNFEVANDTSIAIVLPLGKHTLKVNNISKGKFTVKENGGMINLNNIEFVIFDILYQSAMFKQYNLENKTFNTRSNVIVVDSFVIHEKIVNDGYPDSILMKFITGSDSTTNDETGELAYQNNMYGLKIVGKGQIYIDRDWDYGFTDVIPKQIETEGAHGLVSNTSKSTILPAKLFLMYVMLYEDEYVVKNIQDVRKGINDKKKENKKKQLEF